MAHAGLILDNPVSGERFIFTDTAGETGGELLAFELEVPAGGRVPGAHVHPSQEERFEVVSGTMRFRKGGDFAIPRNTPRAAGQTVQHG